MLACLRANDRQTVPDGKESREGGGRRGGRRQAIAARPTATDRRRNIEALAVVAVAGEGAFGRKKR